MSVDWIEAMHCQVLFYIVISNSLWKVLQDHGVLFPILRLFNSALEFNVFNEGEKKKERKRCERVEKEGLTDWWKAFQQLYFSILEQNRCFLSFDDTKLQNKTELWAQQDEWASFLHKGFYIIQYLSEGNFDEI